MTATTKSTMERAIVGTMWAILLLYIGWSSLRIMDNSTTLAVIDERSNAILERMDKVESLRTTLDVLRANCLERNKSMMVEVETLKRHVATDSVWRQRIDERINDLRDRIMSLEKGGKK